MRDWKAEITRQLPDPAAVREDVLEEMAQQSHQPNQPFPAEIPV
jgi:hypothetical protein